MSEQQTPQTSSATDISAIGAPAGSVPAPAATAVPLLDMSEKAAAQVRQIQERENRTGTALRVSVIGGGCSGLSYKLAFEDGPKERDKVFTLHGIPVLVDSKSLLFLKGILIDFTDGLTGQGFVFTNPNAKSTCGCGTSFSA